MNVDTSGEFVGDSGRIHLAINLSRSLGDVLTRSADGDVAWLEPSVVRVTAETAYRITVILASIERDLTKFGDIDAASDLVHDNVLRNLHALTEDGRMLPAEAVDACRDFWHGLIDNVVDDAAADWREAA